MQSKKLTFSWAHDAWYLFTTSQALLRLSHTTDDAHYRAAFVKKCVL